LNIDLVGFFGRMSSLYVTHGQLLNTSPRVFCLGFACPSLRISRLQASFLVYEIAKRLRPDDKVNMYREMRDFLEDSSPAAPISVFPRIMAQQLLLFLTKDTKKKISFGNFSRQNRNELNVDYTDNGVQQNYEEYFNAILKLSIDYNVKPNLHICKIPFSICPIDAYSILRISHTVASPLAIHEAIASIAIKIGATEHSWQTYFTDTTSTIVKLHPKFLEDIIVYNLLTLKKDEISANTMIKAYCSESRVVRQAAHFVLAEKFGINNRNSPDEALFLLSLIDSPKELITQIQTGIIKKCFINRTTIPPMGQYWQLQQICEIFWPVRKKDPLFLEIDKNVRSSKRWECISLLPINKIEAPRRKMIDHTFNVTLWPPVHASEIDCRFEEPRSLIVQHLIHSHNTKKLFRTVNEEVSRIELKQMLNAPPKK